MITGFEEITEPLTPQELEMVPGMAAALATRVGKSNAISAAQITARYAERGIKMEGPRIRKIINHIRRNGMVSLLIATSRGYYVASSAAEAKDYIKSLEQRRDAIAAVCGIMNDQLAQYIENHQ